LVQFFDIQFRNLNVRIEDETGLESTETTFLRSVEGVTLREQKRSDDIKKDLGVYSMNEKLQDYRNNFRKIFKNRKREHSIAKISKYSLRDRRQVRRTRMRWRDQQKPQ
jgi:hypothetical protein